MTQKIEQSSLLVCLNGSMAFDAADVQRLEWRDQCLLVSLYSKDTDFIIHPLQFAELSGGISDPQQFMTWLAKEINDRRKLLLQDD